MLWSIEHYSQILQCFALLFSLALMWLKCKGALMPGTGRKCMQNEKSKVVGKWGFVGNLMKYKKYQRYPRILTCSFGWHPSGFLCKLLHFWRYSCRTKNPTFTLLSIPIHKHLRSTWSKTEMCTQVKIYNLLSIFFHFCQALGK